MSGEASWVATCQGDIYGVCQTTSGDMLCCVRYYRSVELMSGDEGHRIFMFSPPHFDDKPEAADVNEQTGDVAVACWRATSYDNNISTLYVYKAGDKKYTSLQAHNIGPGRIQCIKWCGDNDVIMAVSNEDGYRSHLIRYNIINDTEVWRRKNVCDTIRDLSLDGQGTIIVCDYQHNQLKLYGLSGDIIADSVPLVIPGRYVSWPRSVCVDGRDRLILSHRQKEGEMWDYAVTLWSRDEDSYKYVRDLIKGIPDYGWICLHNASLMLTQYNKLQKYDIRGALLSD